MPMQDLQITCARVVCRSQRAIEPLAHVCACVASFLVPPPSWTVANAIERGCPRLAIFKIDSLVADAALSATEKRSLARKAVYVAARAGDLKLVNRMMVKFGSVLDEQALREAVRGGHFDVALLIYSVLTGAFSSFMNARTLFPSHVIRDAVKSGKLEIMWWICRLRGGDKSIVPLGLAAECGHLDMVEWLCTGTGSQATLQSWEVVSVAEAGHGMILKYFHARRPLQFTSEAMDNAAHAGHLDLVRWMAENGGEGCTERAINIAAGKGDLELIRWLHLNVKPSSAKCSTHAMNAAARSGNLEIVKFLHENRSEGCTSTAMNDAAANNHLDVVRYLATHRLEGCTHLAMDRAAKNGHLDMVKWLHEHFRYIGCTSAAMDGAAEHGHLAIIQFLHENRSEGCTTRAMNGAARNGHLDVVQWLHASRTEGCTTSAMNTAAANGHIEVVLWLHTYRQEGCTTAAMDFAAWHGHLDIVKFLHMKRWEGCTYAAIDLAAKEGHLDVIKWLHQHRREGCTVQATDDAASNGHVAVIKWLGENISPGWNWAFLLAAERSDFETLKWLYAHGSANAVDDAIEAAHQAARSGRIEVLQWLLTHFHLDQDLVSLLNAAFDSSGWYICQWFALMRAPR